MKSVWLWFLLLVLPITVSASEILSFDALWLRIKSNSPGMSQQGHEVAAARLAEQRSQLHWLPSLGLQGRFVSSNDPGTLFFSRLSQRQVESQDFLTQSLNHPAWSNFVQFSLGADLPLFEGGRRVAEAKAAHDLLLAEETQSSEYASREYIAAVTGYASLSVLEVTRQRVTELNQRVDAILSKYSIGGASNPVGHSGMLGLQVLKNRTQALQNSLNAEQGAVLEALSLQARLDPQAWKVSPVSSLKFLNESLPVDERGSVVEADAEKSNRLRSNALDHLERAERSNYLPRIGLFAEEGFNSGSRGAGSAFSAGAYLQWSLLDPRTFYRSAESQEKSLSQLSKYQDTRLRSEVSREETAKKETALRANLELLNESEQLMLEQMKTTSRLFQSGTVSALQLAEVLNRRLDLILNLKDTEYQLIELRGSRSILSGKLGDKL